LAMSPPRRKSSVIGSGAAEERKRGQRLFGALLGTLSQTSAKPAHRRRDEIEKRQQDKLRQKDEELADEKRKKRQELDALRRKEQQLWDKQGTTIKHQNMRATANFLKTKTEPALYYRPWDLRSEEEERIKQQIEDTERLIEKELAESSSATTADPGIAEPGEMDVTVEEKEKPELVGEATNEQEVIPEPQTTNDVPIQDAQPDIEKKVDEKAHDDHGGEELVEGQEDDVIY